MRVRKIMTRVWLALVMLVLSVATVSAQSEPSSISVEGAYLADEMTLVIPAVTIEVDGWIVVHDSNADGEIVAPAIISEPVHLEAGSHENIEITLTIPKAEGDKVFPMLHIDEGESGTYEFPGADTPVKNGEDIVMVGLTLSAEAEEEESSEAPAEEGDAAPEEQGEEEAAPQVDSAITVAETLDLMDGKIVIPGATLAQDGWLVIHDSDAEGNIVAPDIISEPVPLKAGTTTDIVVTLTSDISDDNHKVFAMLHIDAGTVGTYEFPGADAPMKNGDDTVVIPFALKVNVAVPAQMPTTGAMTPEVIAMFAAAAAVIFAGLVIAHRQNV